MALTTFFTSAPGVDTGRLQPAGFTAPEGDYVLSLGSDRAGRMGFFRVGDYIQYVQVLLRGESDRVSHRLVARGPSVMPVVSLPGPFALADGQTLEFAFDGSTRVVTIDAADFVAVGAATAPELAAVLSRDLLDATVSLTPNSRVMVVADRTGRESEVVVGGTAAVQWAYPTWRYRLVVDGVEATFRDVRPGDYRTVTATAPTALLPDSIPVALRLELVDAAGLSDDEVIDLELPGAWVDDVVPEAVAGIYTVNHDPEVGETRVRVGGPVSVDVATSGDDVDVATLRVYAIIGGVESTVYDAGFQAGWTGPRSALTTLATNHVRVVADPESALPGSTEIAIRVEAETVGGLSLVSYTYTFVTVDTDPPGIEVVEAAGKTRLVVRYDEPVADDAVDSAVYTLVPADLPAVTPLVVVADRLSDSAVALTLDRAASPGRAYTLMVSGINDVEGNDSGPLSYTFTAFRASSPARRRFLITDFVPDSNLQTRDGGGDLARFLAVIQEVVDVLICEIDAFAGIYDPDRAPDQWVDAMLWDLGNPFTFEISPIQKRRLLRVLLEIYTSKGTVPGLVDAVRFFTGIEVEVNALNIEGSWILGEDELGETTVLGPSESYLLYSFEVESPVVLDDATRRIIDEVVEYMKPAHTHYLALIEPVPPMLLDHVELGESELGETFILH